MTAVYSFDVETHASADLKKVGAVAYLNDPDTDVILFAYHPLGDPSPPRVWHKGEPPPQDLVDHVNSGGLLSGWNVTFFDRFAWDIILTRRYRFPAVKPEQWLDSMHFAAGANLPRALDACAKAVGVNYVSNLKDNNLLRRVTNKNKTPVIQGADLEWLTNRCIQDTIMEEETLKRLPPWFTTPPWDRMREIDREINDRGILMDVELVRGLEKAATEETKRLDAEIRKLTSGAVPSTSNIEKLKVWLMDNGVVLPKKGSAGIDVEPEEEDEDDEDNGKKIAYRLRKSDIADLLARDDVPDHCRQALEWRAEAAKASVKKLRRMLSSMSPDGRLRGALILFGAQSTGRFSGAAWQPHNFVRDVVANPDEVELITGVNPKVKKKEFERLSDMALRNAIEVGRRGDRDEIETLYTWTREDAQKRTYVEGVLPWIGRMLRRTLTAREGHMFLNGDFSQIEARIPVWLAQQLDKVEVFRRGEDIYRAQAAPTYGKLPHELTKTERQIGKVMTLFLGFAGGVNAFIPAAMNYGLRIAKEEGAPIVASYRADNPMLVNFWNANLEAAVNAVMYPGSTFSVAPLHNIAWCMDGNCLMCRLPSGRVMRYWAPRLEQGFWDDGSPKKTLDLTMLTIKGRAIFRRTFWRGLATENCLAEDTDVLTSRGWVPIVNVTRRDLLWDGHRWVSHDGLIHRGKQKTIDFDGVNITPDHKVLINASWKNASEGSAREATASFARHHWLPDRYPDGRKIFRVGQPKGSVVSKMSVREYTPANSSGVYYRPSAILRMSNFRLKARREKSDNTREMQTACVSNMESYARKMLQHKKRQLEKLRRARDNCLSGVEKFRHILDRHRERLCERTIVGSHRQLTRVFTRELSLGYSSYANAKQAKQPHDKHSARTDASSRSRRIIWNKQSYSYLPREPRIIGTVNVCASGEFREVYDILNAGPNHRFTVRTKEGQPFIVSNCVQAIAADMLATAICNMYDAGFPIVLHVHDSITAEIPREYAERRLPEFEQCLVTQPSWTAGLPIAAACDISTRFG
jgi:DNA polymerase